MTSSLTWSTLFHLFSIFILCYISMYLFANRKQPILLWKENKNLQIGYKDLRPSSRDEGMGWKYKRFKVMHTLFSSTAYFIISLSFSQYFYEFWLILVPQIYIYIYIFFLDLHPILFVFPEISIKSNHQYFVNRWYLILDEKEPSKQKKGKKTIHKPTKQYASQTPQRGIY